MSLIRALLGSAAPEQLYVDDVFSAWPYLGNGSTQSIVNGIDLAGKGGMAWGKYRGGVEDHWLFDTVRGASGNNVLVSNTTAAAAAESTFTGFTSSGWTMAANGINVNNRQYGTWSFRVAPKFFYQAQVTVSGSNQTVDLSSLGTVGMVVVKRTDGTSAWFALHRSNTAGKICYLNTTAAETTDGSITLSGTTLTLVQATIGNGTYIVYAWAHDTSATGIIQCGTASTDGSGYASINLGWEPQYVLTKRINNTETWKIQDSSRGFTNDASASPTLNPSSSSAEAAGTYCGPIASGFILSGENASSAYIYLAIRRPNKPPTVGTQVYNAIKRAGTPAVAVSTGVGFAPDMVLVKNIDSNTLDHVIGDRLRGPSVLLKTDSTVAETADSIGITSFDMDGISVGADGTLKLVNYINTDYYMQWFFKRAPGVFDEVCYTLDGSGNYSGAHNLGVTPELIINKCRNDGSAWWSTVGSGLTSNHYFLVNQSTSAQVDLGSQAYSATSTTFSVLNGLLGVAGATAVSWMFATLAGISKVFSYTGNGSSLTINCGFAAGARFILIKRTDSTGDWFVWDSVRGIVAGNDPHTSLNTTVVQVATDDSVDPDSSGFIVNENSATHINVNGGTYTGLAFA